MQDGWTPLFRAAKNGHLEVIKVLIKRGAQVQHQDKVIAGEGREAKAVWARRFAESMMCWWLEVRVEVMATGNPIIDGGQGFRVMVAVVELCS